jgi:hypothetical protein
MSNKLKTVIHSRDEIEKVFPNDDWDFDSIIRKGEKMSLILNSKVYCISETQFVTIEPFITNSCYYCKVTYDIFDSNILNINRYHVLDFGDSYLLFRKTDKSDELLMSLLTKINLFKIQSGDKYVI